jgi:SpoVK/Ycf46/Vps4 family AAA+-type ATPase
LVRALCREQVFGFTYLDAATLLSCYVGESERMIRDVFEQAKQQSPCLVFIDEIEVIAGSRQRHQEGGRAAEEARLLSALLIELDGFAGALDVCLVGATNLPHTIDPAILRPGRLDLHLYVPPPSPKDREDILRAHLVDFLDPEDGDTADALLRSMAEQCEGFTGADVVGVCKECLVIAAQQMRDRGFDEGGTARVLDRRVVSKVIRHFPVTCYPNRQILEFAQLCSRTSLI